MNGCAMLSIKDSLWVGVADLNGDEPVGGIEPLRWHGFHSGKAPNEVSLPEALGSFRVVMMND